MDIRPVMETNTSNAAQDPDFTSPIWIDMDTAFHSPHQSPPLPEYHGFLYGSSPTSLTMEPSYGMSLPPPYASLPLPLPSHPWPSMLATQPQLPDTYLPPVPIPASQPKPLRPMPGRKSSTGGPTPRRTLTDEDRRRMCLYHEENKTAKQTDIGALFGVERSTVSKVLRHKDKYLNPDDGSRSPIKRQKSRNPDIEKALSNWVRNNQRHGLSLTDDEIREKAHFFASTCGSPEGKDKVLDASWLKQFKADHNLNGAKTRRASAGTRTHAEKMNRLDTLTSVESTGQMSTGRSSASASALTTPSSLSPAQSPDNIKTELAESLADLVTASQSMKFKSTTSLDTASLSGGVTSPTSTLVSNSPFTPTSQSRTPSTASNAIRPRSQSFPATAIDPKVLSGGGGNLDLTSASRPLHQSLSLSILESPLEEDEMKMERDLNASVAPKPDDRRPRLDVDAMRPPPVPKSSTVSPVSSPGSPTQDDARKALELVMNYFQNQPSGLAAQEYVTIGKLMERLELAQSQQQNGLPGGLTRIGEMNDSPRVNKKRSIHTLS